MSSLSRRGQFFGDVLLVLSGKPRSGENLNAGMFRRKHPTCLVCTRRLRPRPAEDGKFSRSQGKAELRRAEFSNTLAVGLKGDERSGDEEGWWPMRSMKPKSVDIADAMD